MKMKRIAVAMLTMTMMLSLAACGADTEISESMTSESEEVSSSVTEESTTTASTESSVATEQTEQTTTAQTEQTTSSTPEEKPKKALEYDVHYAMNGQFCLYADDGYYIYDAINDKILNEKALMNRGYDIAGSVGNLVLFTETSDLNSEYFRKMTRITNGQMIVTSTSGYTILTPDFSTSYLYSNKLLMPSSIPVAQVEEGFTGNVLKLGLLGTDGEWLYEPSENYSVCDGSVFSIDVLINGGTKYYGFGDSVLIIISTNENYGTYVYSFKNDSITTLNQRRLYEIISLTEDHLIAKCDDQIVRYDEATGETKILHTQQGHQLSATATNCYVKISDGADSYTRIYDIKTARMLDYDLSAYNVNYIIGGNENFIAFDANNPSGDSYIILMDKNGEMIMDPIKGSLYLEAEAYERENSYIIGCKGKTFIIDKETHEIKEANIESYDNTSSIALSSSGYLYNVDKRAVHSIYK